MAFVIIFHTFISPFLGSFLLPFLGSFLLSFVCVSVCVCVCVSVVGSVHIYLCPGARLVAPAVGAAYLVKWLNIALQAAQMGVIRCVPIYPYICPNWGKIGSLS